MIIDYCSGSVVPGLEKLKSLRELTLNDLEESQIPRLYVLKKLAVLDISKTGFTKDQITKLKLELPKTQIISGSATDVTENMISNRVEPIIQIPSKTIEIQSDETSSVSEKNVSLTIPENAFLDESGNIYKGKVIIALTVYDNAIQTALAGIPMTFNENNQEELFASNGMLKFEATGENKEVLKPNPDNLIQASVGNLQPQNPGGLYAFNQQTAQWNTISPVVNTSNFTARLQQAVDSINRLDMKQLVPRVYNDRIFSIYPKFSRYDRTEISLYSKYIPAQPTSTAVTNNRSNALGGLMTTQKWVIDTVITKDMKRSLQIMKKETRGWKNKKFKGDAANRFIPRLMNRLTIEEDPGRDNYRLNFRYRDSLVSLPVALAGKSNKQIQKNTTRFHSGVKQAKLTDHKEDQKYQNSLEDQLKLAEVALRNRMITAETILINRLFGVNNWVSPGQLNFGLSAFGLINCDFFQRKKPDFYIFAAKKLRDQNGKSHAVPETVIAVDPLINFYMETGSIGKINCFESTILVFKMGDKELGISKPKKGEKSVSDVILIDITDKTPDEISKAILSI